MRYLPSERCGDHARIAIDLRHKWVVDEQLLHVPNATRQIRECRQRIPSASRAAGRTPAHLRARATGELDLSFLWRRKWWIAASVAVSLVVCFVADLVITPRFRAVAQILIGPVDLRVIEKDVMPLAQTADANVIQVESETRVLTSDKVLLRVVEGEQLASDPEFRGRPTALGQVIATVLAPLRRNPVGHRGGTRRSSPCARSSATSSRCATSEPTWSISWSRPRMPTSPPASPTPSRGPISTSSRPRGRRPRAASAIPWLRGSRN